MKDKKEDFTFFEDVVYKKDGRIIKWVVFSLTGLWLILVLGILYYLATYF